MARTINETEHSGFNKVTGKPALVRNGMARYERAAPPRPFFRCQRTNRRTKRRRNLNRSRFPKDKLSRGENAVTIERALYKIKLVTVISNPTLRQAKPRERPEVAMCVRKISAQCVLQFTPSLAAGCVLHRPTNRVIHRLESYNFFLKNP